MFDTWRKIVNKLEETGNPYGMIPSPPDPRDFQYKAFAGVQALPSAFSRKSEMPHVRDQGSFGTCVGFATWAMKEWQELQQGDNPDGGMSPRFIYQMAKQLDGIPRTTGTYPRVAFKVLQDYGDAPERTFPYNELHSDVNLPRPPENVIKTAEPYKISVYAVLNGLDEIKRAIVEQGPVVLGLLVTDSFVNAKDYIPQPAGHLRGGHAIVACGYDDNVKLGPYKGGVLLMNSWGTSWGCNGFSWLPYEAWSNKRWMIDVNSGIPFVSEAWASVDVPYTPKMTKQMVLKLNDKNAYVDGQYVQLDVPPKLDNGRTMVPIRFVAERLGYIVNWQPEHGIVELKRPW